MDLVNELVDRLLDGAQAGAVSGGHQMGKRALQAEAEARAKIGIAAAYLTRADLMERFGIDRQAAILSPDLASANPAQFRRRGCWPVRWAAGRG